MPQDKSVTKERTTKIASPQRGMAMEGPIAKWYAKARKTDPQREALWRRIDEIVPDGGCILEVAPGPGYLAIELAKLGKYRVDGLDSSKSFVDIAREKAQEAGVSVEFQRGDAADLPYDDDIFDFIVCVAAFKNFTEPVRAMAEMHRVLKTGGKALIQDLRRDADVDGIRAEAQGMDLNPVNRWFVQWTLSSFLLKRAYTQADIQDFAAQTEFGSATIETNGIGMDIWLEKQG